MTVKDSKALNRIGCEYYIKHPPKINKFKKRKKERAELTESNIHQNKSSAVCFGLCAGCLQGGKRMSPRRPNRRTENLLLSV